MRTPSSQKCRLDPLSRRRWHRLGLWLGFFRESWSACSLRNSPALQLYAGLAEGCLGLDSDWATLCFLDTTFQRAPPSRARITRRGFITESRVSPSHTTERRTLSARIAFNSQTAAPTIWDCPVLPGLRREISTPALTIARSLWLGLYWLNVHDGVAEWIAVDAPGNFENGIRIFGSSGDDIVYARVTRQWAKGT
jgi:hypothetical protein